MTVKDDGNATRSFVNDKKLNMDYWDVIESFAEEYADRLVRYSITFPTKAKKNPDENGDEIFLDICKQITDFSTRLLETEYGCKFPYVDENF